MDDKKNRESNVKSAKKVKRIENKNSGFEKKDRKSPMLRTDAERRHEVNIIINKLSELQLTMAYEPIRELYVILNDYVKNGGTKDINIPFPTINKRIKGILSETINQECCICLKHENF